MTLQSSGAISLGDVQNEFGGEASTSISEYYRGGSYVANVPENNNIPTGGTISLSQFYGRRRWQTQFIDVYDGGRLADLNLFNAAMGAGLNNSLPIYTQVKVHSGGIIHGSDTGQYALNTGDGWGVTPYIVIIVDPGGFITGAGGASPGANGGPALLLTQSTLLLNYGVIQSGGGAGGPGGFNIHGGGAGYPAGPGYDNTPLSAGGEGPVSGTLEQGGSFADESAQKRENNGGAGGGWVARPPYTYSTDGYGYGATSPEQDNFANPRGGGAPSRAITRTDLLMAGSYTGTLRGFINLDAGKYNLRCSGYTLTYDYYDGYGGWAYDQLEGNSPSCGYVEPPPPTDTNAVCFRAGTQIRTPQGPCAIELILPGSWVQDEQAQWTQVRAIHRPRLGSRALYLVDGSVVTGDHLYRTPTGWACADPVRYAQDRWQRLVLIDGHSIDLGTVHPDSVAALGLGCAVVTSTGRGQIQQFDLVQDLDPDEIMYGLVTESGTYVLQTGHVVDGIPQQQ